MCHHILHLETVHQCNCCLQCRTWHPLVSAIELPEAHLPRKSDIRVEFYTIFLAEHTYNEFVCGRENCDYSDGTLTFLCPGNSLNQGIGHKWPAKGWMLAFHPDLIRGTPLEEHLSDYSFFSYQDTESLHISCREKQVLYTCFQHIREEIQHDIDEFSKILITGNIKLLLDYCRRFYTRQFITRCENNQDILRQLDRLLHEYIHKGLWQTQGIPTETCCAEHLNLSPAYFRDLLKYETGFTLHEYAQKKRIETAREFLTQSDQSVSQIAALLGFPSVPYFSRIFRKITGATPQEYRIQN